MTASDKEYSADKSGEYGQEHAKFNEHQHVNTIREWMFIFMVCLTQVLTQASFGQVPMLPLPTEFGIMDSLGGLSWTAASMPLVIGSFILVSGRLGDIFGYKKMYVLGYFIVSISSMLVGISVYTKSNAFFNAMRGIEGLGFSLALTNSLAILGSYYPDGSPKKTLTMCLFASVTIIGAVLGLIFGSLIADTWWWPWAFWLVSIITFCAAFLAWFILPGMTTQCLNKSSTVKFDYYGAFTLVPGLILMGFALTQGPTVGWHNPYVYVLFIIGILCMALFVVAEKYSDQPLVSPSLYTVETAVILFMLGFGYSSFGVWLFNTVRFSVLIDQNSNRTTAIHFIPILAIGIFTGAAGVLMCSKLSAPPIMITSMVGFLLTTILMGTRPAHQIYWGQKFVSILISSIGTDLSLPAATLLMSKLASPEHQGMAASLVTTFLFFAVSVGISLAVTVEVYTTKNDPMDPQALQKGIRNQFRMSMGLAGCGLTLGILYTAYRMFKNHNPKT